MSPYHLAIPSSVGTGEGGGAALLGSLADRGQSQRGKEAGRAILGNPRFGEHLAGRVQQRGGEVPGHYGGCVVQPTVPGDLEGIETDVQR